MQASEKEALGLAFGALTYLRGLLDQRGTLEVVDGQFRLGGSALVDGTEIVDEVKTETGFGCTIFQGEVRLATTAFTPDGSKRAIGMRPAPEILQQVYRRGERFTGITRTLMRDWVIVYAPLRDRHDKIVGMLAAYRQLADFLHRLALLNGTPEGVLLHTLEGRITDANRTACDMLALSKPELLELSMHDFTAAAEHVLRDAWSDVGDEPIRLESFWRRSDVYEYPVELFVCRAELPGPPRLLTIVRDFTEQHAARERLRTLHAQLAQSEKMAALGKLVAGVTHDVNTPLGAVRSGHETMAKAVTRLRAALDDAHPDALQSKSVARSMQVIEQTNETVGAGTERINEVVRRLRSFARLDQGSLQEVDLRSCIEDVLTLVEHRVPDAVAVTCELDVLPPVRCNPADINQLIMNLVVNAIEAVGDSGTISITATADDEYLALVVADDGEGIAAPDLANVFNPGFTTKGVGFGGGLGLSIATQVAHQHGGTISVESSRGEGASFTTRLPLTPAIAKRDSVP